MKKLDVSAVSNSAQFYPKKGTLDFLQLAYQEGFAEVVKALIGPSYNPSTIYVLSGVVDTGTHPTYTTTAGCVFYNGEIFLIDPASFTATGANVAVFSIIQTQYTTDADPVTFSDTTTHNIHNIRKMQLTQGATGSGLADLSQAYYLSFYIPPQLNLTATGQAVVSGVYPNLNLDVPNSTALNPVLFAGSYNIGNVPASGGGGGAYSVTFGTTLSTASYYVMGCIISNGTPANDATVTWAVHNKTTTGFQLHVQEWVNSTQNIAFEYIIFKQ